MRSDEQSQKRKEYIEELSEDFLNAHKAHYRKPTVDSYNELRRVARALAHAHLVDKAATNVKAAIELEKSYPEAPPLNDPANIKDVQDVTEGQMTVAQAKMELSHNKQNIPLNLKEQQKAYEEGKISYRELKDHLKVIDLMNKAEAYGKLTGDMIVNIGQSTFDALSSVKDDV